MLEKISCCTVVALPGSVYMIYVVCGKAGMQGEQMSSFCLVCVCQRSGHVMLELVGASLFLWCYGSGLGKAAPAVWVVK